MFCSGLIRSWIYLFNWLLIMTGVLIESFAIYVAAVAFSGFFFVLLGVGIYFDIVGGIGLRSIKSRSPTCVNIYAFLFFCLIAFQSALVIGFLFFEDKTISFLQDLNSDGDNGSIKTYLDNHRSDLKWSSLVVLTIESFTFMLAICCSSRIAGLNPNLDSLDEDDLIMDDRKRPLMGSAHYGTSATPQTDQQRARLNEKYGNAFAKKSEV